MTTTYHIAQLQRNMPDGVFTTSHWTAYKVDGEFSASAYGSIGLPAKDPSDLTYVPYADITEALAIECKKNVMGEETVAALEAGLLAQIEAQRNPKQFSGTPWAAEASY